MSLETGGAVEGAEETSSSLGPVFLLIVFVASMPAARSDGVVDIVVGMAVIGAVRRCITLIFGPTEMLRAIWITS